MATSAPTEHLAGKHHDVIGPQQFHYLGLEPCSLDGTDHQPSVEDMVMNGPELDVSLCALAEITAPRSGILRHVVQGEDLLEMRQVILSRATFEIVDQVLHGGNRPTVIERAIPMRHDQDQPSARLENAPPFRESAQRICRVFEHVRRQHEVVGLTRDHAQVGSLGDKLLPRCLSRIESERVTLPACVLPNRVLREVAVIYPCDESVDREQASSRKNRAGSTDFDPRRAADDLPAYRKGVGLRCANPANNRTQHSCDAAGFEDAYDSLDNQDCVLAADGSKPRRNVAK